MLRLLPALLVLGLALVALIDCLARDADEILGLPKVIWVLVILLFPLLGPVAWFFAGRAPSTSTGPRGSGTFGNFGGFGRAPRPRPIAPDDNPDFLRGLGETRRRPDDDEERRPDS
jgi:Phospholipase_D-nuclease N-terminal